MRCKSYLYLTTDLEDQNTLEKIDAWFRIKLPFFLAFGSYTYNGSYFPSAVQSISDYYRVCIH
jgi:hypothetical protein